MSLHKFSSETAIFGNARKTCLSAVTNGTPNPAPTPHIAVVCRAVGLNCQFQNLFRGDPVFAPPMTSSAECNARNAASKLIPACRIYFTSVLRNSERHNNGATQTGSASQTASASSEFASRMVKYAIKLVSVTITVLTDEFHNIQRLALELHRRPHRPPRARLRPRCPPAHCGRWIPALRWLPCSGCGHASMPLFQGLMRFLRQSFDGDRYHGATITQPFWKSTLTRPQSQLPSAIQFSVRLSPLPSKFQSIPKRRVPSPSRR